MSTYGFDQSVDQIAMAKIVRFAGADYAVAGPGDWRVTAVAGQDRTVAIAAGTGYGHFILDEDIPADTRQLPAVAAGSKRWDLISRRRVWNPAGGGSSNFAVCQGQAAAAPQPGIPATRLRGPGATDDQPLALVLTVPSGPPEQIINLRSWPSMVYAVDSLLALPEPKLGAEVQLGDTRYRRQLDAAGNPAWITPKSSTPTIIDNSSEAQAGFVVDTGFVNNCIVDPSGKVVEYKVEVRRTGAALSFGSSGAMADVPVAKLLGPTPDANAGGYSIPVQFRGIGGASSTQESGIFCHGYLTSAGMLVVDSGIPGGFIAKRATVGNWSLQACIAFRKA